LCCL